MAGRALLLLLLLLEDFLGCGEEEEDPPPRFAADTAGLGKRYKVTALPSSRWEV